MRHNPERLAWAVLLTSFFICIGLAIAAPLSVRHYVLYANVRQRVKLEVQQPPLSVTLAGRGLPVSIAEGHDDISERTIIDTKATAGRLVMYAPQAEYPIVATAQLYDNTTLVLTSARSPRFPSSRLPHRVVLRVKSGRVRINVFDTDERATIVEIETPYGKGVLTEGSYEVKVNGATAEITVRTGHADVIDDLGQTEQSVSLGPSERAVIEEGQILGPQPAARNLIVNGDFQAPLEHGWRSYNEQKEPPPGEISIITDAEREAANFYREGSNWAEVGIRQEINYDVRDFTSLALHLAVNIAHEDITGYGGCGTLSSECPIIVLLDYKDIHDTDRQWRHGFYIGEPASDWLLYPWTEQVSPGNWQTYDSGNLMEELADTPPALIKSLTIYASGHSFHAMVTEVELLAQE